MFPHVETTRNTALFIRIRVDFKEMTLTVESTRPSSSTELSAAEQLAKMAAENAALKVELQGARTNNQRYLQNVAHQLTAPLGAIKWSIEALKDPEIRLERKGKLLSSIYSQATILVHLIKNFALMSNLEADHELGQFREKPEPVDILRMCINLANDFQPQAAERGVGIVVSERSFLTARPPEHVRIVKNLVAQALSNLLENAVKYSDIKTTIVIKADIAADGALEGSLIVSVVSIGIPIKELERKRLFDRGFRGDAAKQKVPAGTGIGLYLANRVMQLHGGALGVSLKGQESRFFLVFPASSFA